MTISFTGDIFLGKKHSPNLFEEIAFQLPPNIAMVVNFEGTLFHSIEDLKPTREKILLTSPAELLGSLNCLPIFLVCVANNHIADYGDKISQDTIRLLKTKYPVFGAGYENENFHVSINQLNDISLGFASYCTRDTTPLYSTATRTGPRELTLEQVQSDISFLRQQTDQLIAVVHWGDEDFHHPKPSQVELGRTLIDSGFDLVIGHHSHTVQGFDNYHGKFIFHSLGNFYFPDHETKIDNIVHREQWMPRRSWGIMPFFDITKKSIKLVDVKFVKCNRGSTPKFINSYLLSKKFKRLSKNIARSNYDFFCSTVRKRESIKIRLEYFANNANKLGTILKKIFNLFKMK